MFWDVLCVGPLKWPSSPSSPASFHIVLNDIASVPHACLYCLRRGQAFILFRKRCLWKQNIPCGEYEALTLRFGSYHMNTGFPWFFRSHCKKNGLYYIVIRRCVHVAHANLTLHELLKGFLLSSKAVDVQTPQLSKKIVSVLLEIRSMEWAISVLCLYEYLRNPDEVHKSSLIYTVQSSIIQVGHLGVNVYTVPFSQLFEDRE